MYPDHRAADAVVSGWDHVTKMHAESDRSSAAAPPPVKIAIVEEWHIAQARQAAIRVADAAGLRRLLCAYVATAVSELAHNLFFHATAGGTISLRLVESDGRRGIEVVAEDRGPGIADVDLALRDGFTTNGGLGGGLPGVKRLMDEFEIDSEVGVGTHVVCRKWGAWR